MNIFIFNGTRNMYQNCLTRTVLLLHEIVYILTILWFGFAKAKRSQTFPRYENIKLSIFFKENLPAHNLELFTDKSTRDEAMLSPCYWSIGQQTNLMVSERRLVTYCCSPICIKVSNRYVKSPRQKRLLFSPKLNELWGKSFFGLPTFFSHMSK